MKRIICFILVCLLVITVGCNPGGIPSQGKAPRNYIYDNETDVETRAVDDNDFGYHGVNISYSERGTMSIAQTIENFSVAFLRYYKGYYYSICKLEMEASSDFYEICFFDRSGQWICNYTIDKLYYFSDFNFEKGTTSVEVLKSISPYNPYPTDVSVYDDFIYVQFIDREEEFTIKWQDDDYKIVDFDELEDSRSFLLTEHLLPKDLNLLI